ncbi:hypothetical protein BKA65DRAFT_555853 [Rhexocercosporidium sp. MPI-PUGE-AT-0058]|nr:hypothetical protein BKA65DRAFT_555853 [Rhexocercosporidium sp. MPI-PUGE-AT-0058]
MKLSTPSLSTALFLAASVAKTNAWIISAYQCSDCSGCPPNSFSGTGSASCTYFNQPVSSVGVAEADAQGCQVYLYYGLSSCQAGDASGQVPRDGSCAPEGGSSNYYYRVTCP